jgi:hypothetical protein
VPKRTRYLLSQDNIGLDHDKLTSIGLTYLTPIRDDLVETSRSPVGRSHDIRVTQTVVSQGTSHGGYATAWMLPDILTTTFYRDAYRDLLDKTDAELEEHWRQFGRTEGRIGSWCELSKLAEINQVDLSRFAWDEYLACNRDLRLANVTTPAALSVHFILFGRNEDRPTALDLPLDFYQVLGLDPGSPNEPAGNWSTEWLDDLTQDERLHARKFCGSLSNCLSEIPIESFVIEGFKFFRGRPPTGRQIDDWCTSWERGIRSRLDLVWEFTDGEFPSNEFFKMTRELESLVEDVASTEQSSETPLNILIMGQHVIDSATWYRKALTAVSLKHRKIRNEGEHTRKENLIVQKTWEPDVSVLCSLYRTENYMETFLKNLFEQTIFDQCEFHILLVDPTELERETYEASAIGFPNISLSIYPNRVGIYKAWNDGIRVARGKYLTNMNADDLRRRDSLELQRNLLNRFPWVDVVYQDVLLTASRDLTWEQIEEVGARSTLPEASLLTFFNYLNPPHNAPMWRRELHDSVGMFDEQYQSAGDVDFWIRCALQEKIFFKTNDPHVAYFHNPGGLSTQRKGVAHNEHSAILCKYMTPRLFKRNRTENLKLTTDSEAWGLAAAYTLNTLEKLRNVCDVCTKGLS